MKDIAGVLNRHDEGPWTIASNLGRMAQSKIHPSVQAIGEMLSNQDFYGTAIRNPGDPIVRQTMDHANHLISQLQPFAFRGRPGKERTPGEIAQGLVGITPAPFNISHTYEQQRAIEASRRVTTTPQERRRRERALLGARE
jgi:hypothetical protein